MKFHPLLLCCPLLLFSGCTNSPTPSCQKTEVLMGTAVTVTAYADSQAAAAAAVEAAFETAGELERIFSPTLEDSELSRLNAAPVGEIRPVSEPLAELMQRSEDYRRLTDGALDCNLGELIALWGIGTPSAHVPSPEDIASCLPQNDNPVEILSGAIRFSEEVDLHFGATAKGYIADEMKAVLQDAGIESGLIVLGGNVLTIGSKPSGEAWKVGITDPFAPDAVTATLAVTDASVVTSGDYERYFEENGVRYHHILDPKTGYPANNGLVSTTIIAPSSLTCDALSTAAFVLGAKDGMALIESLPDTEAVFLTEDCTLLTSSGIAQYQFTQVEP